MLQVYITVIHSFKGHTSCIAIIKYGLYSLCCTIYPYNILYPIFFLLLFLILLLFFFLVPYLWHMEVPRLEVQLELLLPACATAIVTWGPSHVCNLHHSSWQHWIPTHWVRPGIELTPSWILADSLPLCHSGTSMPDIYTSNPYPHIAPPPPSSHC